MKAEKNALGITDIYWPRNESKTNSTPESSYIRIYITPKNNELHPDFLQFMQQDLPKRECKICLDQRDDKRWIFTAFNRESMRALFHFLESNGMFNKNSVEGKKFCRYVVPGKKRQRYFVTKARGSPPKTSTLLSIAHPTDGYPGKPKEITRVGSLLIRILERQKQKAPSTLRERIIDALNSDCVPSLESLISTAVISKNETIDYFTASYPVICLAAEKGALKVLQLLLTSGANIHAMPKGKEFEGKGNYANVLTLFIKSLEGLQITREHLNGIEVIINAGIDIHAFENTSKHPANPALHTAAKYNLLTVCQLLLEKKASPEAHNHEGNTALYLYLKTYGDRSSEKMIKLFIQYSANTLRAYMLAQERKWVGVMGILEKNNLVAMRAKTFGKLPVLTTQSQNTASDKVLNKVKNDLVKS